MIFFHHIPKTAGTTINDTIFKNNPDKTLIVGQEGVSALEGKNINDYDFVGGHLPFPDVKDMIQVEVSHVSILRNPLLRIISYFEMAYRDNEVFREEICSVDKWGVGFDVFYDRFIVKAGLVNISCSYFSKSKRFYDALVAIRENFSLVGDVSKLGGFTSSFNEIAKKNGSLLIPDQYPAKNRSSKGDSIIEKISPKTLEKIKDDNQEDFLLYWWLMKKHDGLFLPTNDF
ncbi:sulfotransferase family 2 domain-containing protein [Halomonas elongata]|uniref:sulfotransferase family 2 domain-containing protein n=1 Tax=Halomonas elongata TaxID=2746 RepID=UPI0023B0D324|nr:sulfotransferase family 2 domain-containing protein [Halomonas elongata]